jgi:tetratricopeptide (TPR) repeat protein
MARRLVPIVLLTLPVPAGAAGSWIEVKTPAFTVVSDGSEKDARRVLGQFQQVRALFKKVWPWARVDPTRPVTILAVRDERGLRRLLPAFWETKNAMHPAGLFVSAPDRNWVAVRMDVGRFRGEDEARDNPYLLVFHEYVHLLVRLNFGHLPLWLNEGLAECWGNTIIEGDRLYQGHYVRDHIRTLRSVTLMPLSRLFAVAPGSTEYSDHDRATLFYAQSWALVHYLAFGSDARRGQLDRLADLLRHGTPEAEAVPQALGAVGALDKELTSYVRRNVFRPVRSSVSLETDPGGNVRALPPAESLALQATFHVAMGRQAVALALVAEALAADPNCVPALEARGLAAWRAGRRDEALRSLEQAVQQPGASGYAHFLYGRLLWESATDGPTLQRVEASLRRAVELDPEFAEAYDSLAQAKAANGAKADETIPLAVRASALEPARIDYRLTAIRLVAHDGQVREAREAAQQLLTWARDEDRRKVEALLRDLSDPRRLPPETSKP